MKRGGKRDLKWNYETRKVTTKERKLREERNSRIKSDRECRMLQRHQSNKLRSEECFEFFNEDVIDDLSEANLRRPARASEVNP